MKAFDYRCLYLLLRVMTFKQVCLLDQILDLADAMTSVVEKKRSQDLKTKEAKKARRLEVQYARPLRRSERVAGQEALVKIQD